MKIWLIAFGIWLMAFQAWGAIKYVRKGAQDSPRNCTNATSDACLTISYGLTKLAGQDTLDIGPGTYTESINTDQLTGKSGSGFAVNPAGLPSWGAIGTPTTIQGAGSTTIILPSSNGCFQLYSNKSDLGYVLFKNLLCDSSNLPAGAYYNASIGGGGNGGDIHHIKFDSIEAKNAPGSAFYIGGSDTTGHHTWLVNVNTHNGLSHAWYVETPDNVIENSICANQGGFCIHQIYGFDTGGGNYPNNSNNVFRYNWLHDSGTTNLFESAAVLLGSGSNNKLYGNIISNNRNYNAIDIGYDSGNNDLIFNNTIYNNKRVDDIRAAIHVRYGLTGVVITNNIMWQNGIDSIQDDSGTATVSPNLTSNPSFTNASGTFSLPTDFQLASIGSPAYNKGTNTNCSGTLDYAGVSRPQFTTCDIGAYEFTGGATLPVVTINVPAVGAVISGTPTTVSGTSSLP